ncbi:putative fungal-specific transcription factor [Thelonectria olida]|uniref:Fungal-specific transcription factor n=1 Tax=Thelonectria olida TaxID=1576542 RepID=A0A9P8WJ22_9HYPO|nr:putative fungal-specific transcription factor [Thelonectria olida]
MAGSKPARPSRSPRANTARTKYVAKACQDCRRRRVKCDGKKPSCSPCLDRELDCVYTTEQDYRGTAPRSFVRLLQARIRTLERILQLHSIDVEQAVAHLAAEDVGTDLHDVEGALSVDEALNFDRDGQARYFGSTSGRLVFSDSRSAGTEVSKTSDVHGNDRPIPSPHAHKVPSTVSPTEHAVSKELESHLLSLYFAWEQPWVQCVDESLFRDSKNRGGRYFSPLLLNCILAVASRYSDRADVRLDPNDPNTAGQMFLDAAEGLLLVDLKYPSITTIQALAILGTVYVAIGCDAAGWLHQGMAVQMALDMGLNLDSKGVAHSNQISSDEARLRRQIYWALYCIDKLFASYTGRVCTMLDFQAAVSLPISPKELSSKDETTHSSLLVTFQCALITQCQILERVLLNLYAPKSPRHELPKKTFFESCLLTLKGWYYDLSPQLKPSRQEGGTELPQAYTLRMVYHTSIILLTKPFLPKRAALASRSKAGERAEDEEQVGFGERVQAICLEAAKEICALGEEYRRAFGSFRQSPITATHCTLSAALVILQAKSWREPNDGFENAIESCIRTLKELSDSWTPPRRFHHNLLKLIEASEGGPLKATSALHLAKGSDGEGRIGQHAVEAVGDDIPGPQSEERGLSDQASFLDEQSTNLGIQWDGTTGSQSIFDMQFWSGFRWDSDWDPLLTDDGSLDIVEHIEQ